MKKVLGLDLGVGSIGWCLLEKDDDNVPVRIIRMGSRIVPLTTDEESGFTKGNACSKNAERTTKRTARKCLNRYQMRRQALIDSLKRLGMFPSQEQLLKIAPLDLWQLRANAATEGTRLELPELGRVLIHICQKRGYKHSRLTNNDAKETAYVAAVNNRYNQLTEEGMTVGQYFAKQLKDNEQSSADGKKYYNYRIKEQVYPRKAYEEEVKAILRVQKTFYPDVLTEDVCTELFEIIFFQRDLKSCKNLVSFCEIESYKVACNGKEYMVGPKVAPRTSPLAQLSMVLEAANNISIRNRRNDELYISPEQRKEIAAFLNTHEVMKLKDLQSILHIAKSDGWWAGKAIGKGLKGNQTLCQLVAALKGLPKSQINELTAFELQTEEAVDAETGEVLLRIDNEAAERQPLYRLWHLIYSVKDSDELSKSLVKLGIRDEEVLQRLCALDFRTQGYASKSAKAISRIIPYLQQGLKYSEACQAAGFDHSRQLNPHRELLHQLPNIQKNELRQPIVEKILNQMVNVVNALLADPAVGHIDEVRVELARELRQSKDERNEAFTRNYRNEQRNKELKKRIQEYGLTPTRTRILKMKMWEESEHSCLYCGQPINVNDFLKAEDVEREHIVPRGLLFDNSFTNQVCACRDCNQKKRMRTAYDFIKNDYNADYLENYIRRVNDLYKKGNLSRTKLNRLLVSYDAYLERKAKGTETEDDKALWENFIDRQLRLSQYISKKSVEILQQICLHVYATSGSVTDFVRHLWGYDEILHSLNFSRYKSAGLTAMVERKHKGCNIQVERIKDWNKRMDNRHHAVDALAIACTTQGIIQRLNTLHASRENIRENLDGMEKPIVDSEKSMLEKWVVAQPHISFADAAKAVSQIVISMRPNTRLTTPGKRYVKKNNHRILAQEGIIVPRVALHAEYLYGRIMQPEVTSEGVTMHPCYVRKYKMGVGGQGSLFTGNESYKETRKIDKNTGLEEIVIKDKILDVLNKVVDKGIRDRILARLNRGFEDGKDYRHDVKRALENLKNLDTDPIYSDDACTRPIRSVRKYVASNTMVAVRKDEVGRPIAFVEPDGNHHVAIYSSSEGEFNEVIITKWQAVNRKLYKLPLIVTNPNQLWDELANRNDVPQEVMENLPEPNSEFLFSMQIGEAFIMGLSDEEYKQAIQERDITLLSDHLYFVQSLSSKDYAFRRHVEPVFDMKKANKEDKRYLRINSLGKLFGLNPHKVKVNILGDIYD